MSLTTPVSSTPSSSVVNPTHSHLDLSHLKPSEGPLGNRVSPKLETKTSETATKIITLKPQSWQHGKALVVGVSRPSGKPGVFTVALDAHDLLSLNSKADIQKDIMDVCDVKELKGDFSRIVFHGCCPINRTLGAIDCGGMRKYDRKIEAQQLAEKVSKLISPKGGFLFFRHCIKQGGLLGIADQSKREKFIAEFQNKGFILVTSPNSPYQFDIPKSVKDLPDPDPKINGKWDDKNGGMVFFKPPTNR